MADETDFGLAMRDVTIDIGSDGGTLRVDQSSPVTKYWINNFPASEHAAWVWIAAWHTKRDQALGADQCRCRPCVWWLEDGSTEDRD